MISRQRLIRVTTRFSLIVSRPYSESAKKCYLDISAAFDMVSHSILLRRLSHTFGVNDAALAWIRSYLTNRSQFVRIGLASSKGPFTIVVCLRARSSDRSFLLFTLHRLRWSLIRLELCSSSTLTIRNCTSLCLSRHPSAQPYNWKTVYEPFISGLLKMDLR